MLGMGNGDILADRTDRRIEDVVLDMLVDLEFGSEGAHQVATLRVMERGRLDRLEQPPNQLMVLDQDLVGLPALAGVTGAHRLHADRLTRQSLGGVTTSSPGSCSRLISTMPSRRRTW